ncbi:MAG: hypothetical protein ACTHYC_14675 [Sphingobacterium sp.]
MTEIGYYITATITILGIAYPVLLQVISRLDEKYSSDHIVSLFKLEWEWKYFKISLIFTLILIVIWSLKIPAFFQIEGLKFLIDNSASILVAIGSILLVFVFFKFVNKILIYYTPSEIIPYLIKKHEKHQENDFRFFQGLTDILLLSIKRQERDHSLTISDFFYSAFRQEREKNSNQPVEYPDLYYQAIYKSIEELAILKEKRNRALEVRTGGGIWLLGEMQDFQISDKTYNWLWRNLLLAIQYKNDDMVIDHWQTAFQYFSSNLSSIYPDYDVSTGTVTIINQEQVEKRNEERNKFYEFHIALGGLLLYEKRYDCLKTMFTYTQSHPPSYELLPESMSEIFTDYNKFRDPYEVTFHWISHKYSFLKLSGMHSDGVIKKWITTYVALLFLRQYTLQPHLITMKPLALPNLPESQGEIRQWADGLENFKILVQENLDNLELMKILHFNFITPEWCEEQGFQTPMDFIDQLKIELEKKYEQNAATLPLDNSKIKQFEESTKTIIEKTFNDIRKLNNDTEIQGDSDKWYVHGKRALIGRDGFGQNPESTLLDYDNFFAKHISNLIKEGVGSTFRFKRSSSYLLEKENIFKGLEALKLNKNHIIINFGLNLSIYLQNNVAGLTGTSYNGVEILDVNGVRSFRNTLFILKRQDLPSITVKSPESDFIDRFDLKKISDLFDIYTSVIGINEFNPEYWDEIRNGKTDEELRKSILLNISFLLEIKWKKEIELIQIVEHSPYRQNGIPNKINDIKPI